MILSEPFLRRRNQTSTGKYMMSVVRCLLRNCWDKSCILSSDQGEVRKITALSVSEFLQHIPELGTDCERESLKQCFGFSEVVECIGSACPTQLHRDKPEEWVKEVPKRFLGQNCPLNYALKSLSVPIPRNHWSHLISSLSFNTNAVLIAAVRSVIQ